MVKEEKIESDIILIPAKKKLKRKKKQPVDAKELEIKVNPWRFTFMVLAIGILSYLAIALIVYIPPFQLDATLQIVISEGLLVALLVGFLVFLGLGIFFNKMKKSPEEDDESTEGKEKKTKEPVGQLTVVYVDDLKTNEDEK